MATVSLGHITHNPSLARLASAPAEQRAHAAVTPAQASGPGVASDSPAAQAPLNPRAVPRAQATATADGQTTHNPRAQAAKLAEQRQALLDQQTIRKLAAIDREVRAHEQAHMAVGGQYAGSATYTYERGPNGVNYAIGGEVPIDTSAEATPAATLRKAQIIQRAALAPAEPSPADRRVAAEAAQMAAQALQELARDAERPAHEATAVEASKRSDGAPAAAVSPGPTAVGEAAPSTAPAVPAHNTHNAARIYSARPATGSLVNQYA